MTDIDTIIENDINQKLLSISVSNGFNNDVSVLPGYMVHYADDLMSAHQPDYNFPCVAFEPVSDDPLIDGAGTKSKNDRVIKIIGAIDVVDRTTVNQRINSLLVDVRKALAFDKFNNGSKASEIVIGRAEFKLPDSQDQYAFFETTVTIKYIEVWK